MLLWIWQSLLKEIISENSFYYSKVLKRIDEKSVCVRFLGPCVCVCVCHTRKMQRCVCATCNIYWFIGSCCPSTETAAAANCIFILLLHLFTFQLPFQLYNFPSMWWLTATFGFQITRHTLTIQYHPYLIFVIFLHGQDFSSQNFTPKSA